VANKNKKLTSRERSLLETLYSRRSIQPARRSVELNDLRALATKGFAVPNKPPPHDTEYFVIMGIECFDS